MMVHNQSPAAKKILCFALLFLFASTSLLCAQAGWKPVKELGFTFKYPSDWNYVDLGKDNYGGTAGYSYTLSPPSEPDFAMLILIFPTFTLELKDGKITFEDMIKKMFEGILKQWNMAKLAIEKADAALGYGPVPGYLAIDREKTAGFRAAKICGDLISGRAAIIIIVMNLPASSIEKGKEYLESVDRILASFNFPK
jgi:hypothetical protein